MSEQMEQDAKEIGAILRDKWNMQPAAIPKVNQITGILETPYIPPPAYGDLNLRAMDKQTLSC